MDEQLFEDNLGQVWKKFQANREHELFNRFPGWYRAIVEETNDPLDMRRIRFRCPELHDSNVKVEDLPWAVPAPWMGGKGSGSFTHPMIKDVVFISFEKAHPYGPIWCAAADPTRRKWYALQSLYTKSPPPAAETGGNTLEPPDDTLPDYLPKDGRPYSTGFRDRYGSFFMLSSTGYFPVEHAQKPAPVGTDALAKRDFQSSSQAPEKNGPDIKYMVMATKYGNTMVLADVGYKWFEEFEGDHEKDEQFEIDRSKYLQKFFNEDQPKDTDQRRIEWRTRYGHKFEMRDVGFEKSRTGEYGDQKTIADSKGKDERWIKIRSKAGHLIELLDTGADPVSDTYIKRTNKDEVGPHDDEEALGTDKRMIRLITRHGNQLLLDDRGSDPINGQNETPRGNGFLMRTRRGFQFEGMDKDELNLVRIFTPKDQVLELNDRFGYVMLTTTQSGNSPAMAAPLSPTQTRDGDPAAGRTRERKPGIPTASSSDPQSNTFHLVLDHANSFIRLMTPEGAGVEVRDKEAPCGSWLELRDNENRAFWMSKKDNWAIWRDKTGSKYILLDDNDDSIQIRNDKGRFILQIAGDIHIMAGGKICLEAEDEIGLKSKKQIKMEAQGTKFVFDAQGFGTNRDVQANKCKALDFPTAPGRDGGKPCQPEPKDIPRKEPVAFDKERGCDPQKPRKGPVPRDVYLSPPGGGNGSGVPSGDPTITPPPQSPTEPVLPGAGSPTPTPVTDPIEDIAPGGGGVLWYGLSDKFLDLVKEDGLTLTSLMNNLNIPSNQVATELQLAKTLTVARSKTQALLSQKRYGGKTLILRVRNVPDHDLLKPSETDPDVVLYRGDIPLKEHMEIFEVGTTELVQAPLFPGAV
jgi:hypothetical protein